MSDSFWPPVYIITKLKRGAPKFLATPLDIYKAYSEKTEYVVTDLKARALIVGFQVFIEFVWFKKKISWQFPTDIQCTNTGHNDNTPVVLKLIFGAL